ncbi:cytochrome c oxidase subunit 3 [Flexibacter flexilis DSM 6793]|uniref:Cytochrome c oxidase subunit 3 n=1 Tax=Flexibacter flexilis DSM 6793 TaxID=927664 RepID=A0A1I1DUF1_9BACT|nr:cytochrome c oxidase subunit 3 [Flexibacter flexilis]SFB78437.1 cytochrome c oxidase subunit 3 [Flexibacter flexilis DSM 6793]
MEIMRSTKYARRDPYVTMLWIGVLGSAIIFGMITFMYGVLKHKQHWQAIALPPSFWLSTFVIMASSLTLHKANAAIRQENYALYKNQIGATLVLGIVFVVTQLWGWQQLVEQGIVLSGAVAGSFVYVLSGLHIAHLVLGVGVLAWAYWDARKNVAYIDGFIQYLNPVKRARLKLVSIYWHFVDIVWLYLFVFFLLQRLL